MSRLRRSLLTVSALALFAPAGAAASIQQGSTTDAGGDADVPGQDIVEVSVRHDTATGATGSVRLAATPASLPAGAAVAVGFGVNADGGDTCAGRLVLQAALKPGDTSAEGLAIDDAGAQTPIAVTKTEPGNNTITLSTTAVRPGADRWNAPSPSSTTPPAPRATCSTGRRGSRSPPTPR